ncbi:MAG: hypothetical protein MUF10_11245 [Thermoanaerobaculaceae bacterium]|jgi:hypothetical protein|nr:hypothetical protein [Thermoanaerobaculaceae bacterium]
MTAYPLTWAEAVKMTNHALTRSVFNTFINEYPFLASIPLDLWPGGDELKYTQTATLPTVAGVDETSTFEATKGTKRELWVRLAQCGGQIEDPIFLVSTVGNEIDLARESVKDLVRAYARYLATQLITGAFSSVAIGTTAGTKGVDACSPGPRTDGKKGAGCLKFNDTGDYFYYKAPGDSDYGTGVAVAADGTYVLRSANESQWVKVTIDISDSAAGGNWEDTVGLVFTDAKSFDGLSTLVDPSYRWYANGSATTPSTNGDALTLEIFDLVLDNLEGSPENQCFVARKGIRRAFKTLMRGSQIQMVDEWMGLKLRRPAMAWEGVPIFAAEEVTKAETVGSTTTCTSLFGVHLNRVDGFHLFYGAQRSRANIWNQQQVTADIRKDGGLITLPAFLRGLPEPDDRAVEPVRLTSAMAAVARKTQCIVEVHGLSNAT